MFSIDRPAFAIPRTTYAPLGRPNATTWVACAVADFRQQQVCVRMWDRCRGCDWWVGDAAEGVEFAVALDAEDEQASVDGAGDGGSGGHDSDDGDVEHVG